MRLLSGARTRGRVVALCCSEGLATNGAGRQLAVELGKAWAEETSRVVLMDADLEHPGLHEILGVPNGVGLTDVLFDRTPTEVVTHTTETPNLSVIPAGPARAAEVDPQVRTTLAGLCQTFMASADTLVAYVPASSRLALLLLELCTDIVILRNETEPPVDFLADDEHRVRAVLGPRMTSPAPAPPEPVQASLFEEPEEEDEPQVAEPTPDAFASLPEPERPTPSAALADIEDDWGPAVYKRDAERRTHRPPSTPVPPPDVADLQASRDTGSERRQESGRTSSAPHREQRTEDLWREMAARARAEAEERARAKAEAAGGRSERADPRPAAPPPPPPPAAPAEPVEELREDPRPDTTAPAESEGSRLDFLPEAKPELEAQPVPVVKFRPPPDTYVPDDEEYRPGRRRRAALMAGWVVIAVVGIFSTLWVFNLIRPDPRIGLNDPVTSIRPPARSAESQRATPEAGTPAPDAEAAPEGEAAAGTEEGALERQDPAAAAAENETPAVAPPAVTPAESPGPEEPSDAGESARSMPDRPFTPAWAPDAPVPYSWSMSAHASAATAASVVASLRERMPGEVFIIAPVHSGGTIFHRVLGSVAPTRQALVEARDRIAAGTRQDPSPWIVREAPMAFLLGEYERRSDADQRVATLDGWGIPAYTLVFAGDDGAQVIRVYAGGYTDADEASAMRELLAQEGLEDAPLVERRGRPGR